MWVNFARNQSAQAALTETNHAAQAPAQSSSQSSQTPHTPASDVPLRKMRSVSHPHSDQIGKVKCALRISLATLAHQSRNPYFTGTLNGWPTPARLDYLANHSDVLANQSNRHARTSDRPLRKRRQSHPTQPSYNMWAGIPCTNFVRRSPIQYDNADGTSVSANKNCSGSNEKMTDSPFTLNHPQSPPVTSSHELQTSIKTVSRPNPAKFKPGQDQTLQPQATSSFGQEASTPSGKRNSPAHINGIFSPIITEFQLNVKTTYRILPTRHQIFVPIVTTTIHNSRVLIENPHNSKAHFDERSLPEHEDEVDGLATLM